MSAAVKRIAALPFITENPFQTHFYAALQAHGFRLQREVEFKVWWLARHRGELDVLHFHWPQNLYLHALSGRSPLSWVKFALFVVRLLVARALGYMLVWTVHEVYPLNGSSRRFDRAAGRVLARACQVLMVNDASTAERARAVLGRGAAGVSIVPHGAFTDVYPEGRSRAEVRAELGIPDDAFVFLLFGHVTAYKRVDVILEAFEDACVPRSALILAGLVQHESSGDAIRSAAKRDRRIKPLLEFIPEERVAELYAAADAAVCPRQDGGTSGALVLALSVGVPVVAAAAPAYEAVTHGDTAAWLFTPNDIASLTAALHDAATQPELSQAKGEAGRRLIESATWEGMAMRAAELLRAADRGRVAPAPRAAAPGA